MPDAPSLDDLIEALLSSLARWILGTGAVSTAIIGIINLWFWAKGWWDLAKDTRGFASRIAVLAGSGWSGLVAALRTSRDVIRMTPPVRILLCLLLTIVILAAQAIWLIASWGISSTVTDLWNFYAWGSWNLPVGVAWRSVTGYLTLGCATLLFLAWITSVRTKETAENTANLAGCTVVMPILLLTFVPLLLTVLGTVLALVSSLLAPLLGMVSAADNWRLVGGLWLAILALLAFSAGSFGAFWSPRLLTMVWRQRVP